MLEEIVAALTEKQKAFLTCLALGYRETVALEQSQTATTTLIIWKMGEEFRKAHQAVLRGNFAAEATKLWVGDKLPDYLERLHGLAVGAKSEKVQLEALKYMVMLAGGEKTTKSELTTMERWIEGGRERTTQVKVEG